jgi:putative MATE family efflux protein
MPPESALKSGPSPLTRQAPATWRLVLHLTWPVLAQQGLVLAVTLSDSYLAGNFKPPNPEHHIAYQAAQTTANYLNWFISCYTIIVSVGSTALVARFAGAANHAAAVRVTNQSILLAVVLGMLGPVVVGLGGLLPLVQLLQLHGDAAIFAVDYLRPLFALLVFQVIEAAGIACLVGVGDTRTGLWVRLFVAVINLPLAWGLCFGFGPLPELGFVGIATGTTISHVLGGSTVLFLLARGRSGLPLRLRLLRPDWSLLRRLLWVSVPAGIDSMSTAVGQLWFLSLVNQLGDVAGSAHGIALRCESLAYLSGAAFGTAAMTLVGQYLGARRPVQASHSGWVAFAVGGGVMCFMGLLFFSMAPLMFHWFCPYPEQRPIIEAGVPVLRLVAFAMPALACTIILTSALRGAGDTRVPVLFTWLGFLGVRIPLTYWLCLDRLDLGLLGVWPGWELGLIGAWWAMFADLHVRGALVLWRFASGRWRRIQV